MKIAMLGPSYPFKGGIAQYTTRLYRELSRNHEVLFVSFKRQYPGWLYPGEGDRDFSDTELFEPEAHDLLDALNPLSWLSVIRHISAFKPDALLLPWWVMFWAPHFIFIVRGLQLKMKGVHVLYLCHNVVAHDSGWLSRLLTRKALSLGDGFLVQSRQDQSLLETMLGRPHMVRAEHPAYSVPKAQLLSCEDARKELGIQGSTLLFFGFVRPYKGLAVLLEAMSKVLESRHCTLIVAGEVWGDASRYHRQVQQLGIAHNIRWESRYIPQDQVGLFFAASDLVVLPYRSATGSGVVKLAYSHLRPVVVSDVGPLADAVEEGATGYVVPEGDAVALADTIVRHLACNEGDFMQGAISAHLARYGWDRLVKAIESLLPEALAD